MIDLHLTVGEVPQGGAVDLVVVEGAQILGQPQEPQPVGHIQHAPLCSPSNLGQNLRPAAREKEAGGLCRQLMIVVTGVIVEMAGRLWEKGQSC